MGSGEGLKVEDRYPSLAFDLRLWTPFCLGYVASSADPGTLL